MARIEVDVTYNADEEVQQVIDLCERLINMSEDKKKVRSFIQGKFQSAFDDGRQFQKTHGNIELKTE